jgi:Fe-S-cluster containining protein
VDRLYQIQEEIHRRTEEISTAHDVWPCRKGCDDCCRSLASVPRVTRAEWLRLASAIEGMEPEERRRVRDRIRQSAGDVRPVVCPLLDIDSGACLMYEARPLACRAYGFFAEREFVLGCKRIESLSRESPDVIWGNHAALEERIERLGPAAELYVWLDSAAG